MIKPWKVLKSTTLSSSKWLPVVQDEVELSNGTVMNDYSYVMPGHVAMVVAITKDKELIFVKQYRHGAKIISTELPTGFIEKDQSPLEAAKAELLQETGYKSDRFFELSVTHTWPSKSNMKSYGFLAIDCEQVSGQDLEPEEIIEIEKVRLVDIDNYLLNLENTRDATISTIALAKLKYPEIF